MENGTEPTSREHSVPTTTAASVEQDSRPLIFISHKHADGDLAKILAKWIDNVTGGHVAIFLSSDAGFETPEIGADLDTDLGHTLRRAGVVILLYTSDDHDWSYCTWECGVALNPGSGDTRILCIQCLADSPTILGSTLKVNIGDEQSVISFAKMFRDDYFFPTRKAPASRQTETTLVEQGQLLHRQMIDQLPDGPLENWSAWPHLRLELPLSVLNELMEEKDRDEQTAHGYRALKENALVQGCSGSTPNLFGKEDIAPGSQFGAAIGTWERRSSGSDHWLYTLAQQIIDSCKRNTPRIKEWARFRPVEGSAEYVLAVGRVKRRAASMVFDCYFYRLVDVQTVEDRMNRLSNMYHKDEKAIDAESITLKKLVKEMEEQGRTRLPLLSNKRPKYIVHGSMIDRFVRQRVYGRRGVMKLTLADLLADESMQVMFSTTFVCVDKSATVIDALAKMRAQRGCEDIFVTETGDADGKVLGWLTDKDLASIAG